MNKNFEKKVLVGLIVGIGLGIGLGFLLIKAPSAPKESALMKGIESHVQKAVGQKKPSEAVFGYWEALKNKDYSKAASYLSEERKKELLEFTRQTDIEEIMRMIAEANEKAGYTKIEIIQEGPITVESNVAVQCSYCYDCRSSSGKNPLFSVEVIRENNQWKVFGENWSGCATNLPGKIEIAPSWGEPERIALDHFRAVFEGNYQEAKKYLSTRKEKEFIMRYSNSLADYLFKRGEIKGRYPSLVEELYETGGQEIKEVMKERVLRLLHKSLEDEEVVKIKGVIKGKPYIEGELKACAEDVYCDNYRFEIQEENGVWKVMSIEPE